MEVGGWSPLEEKCSVLKNSRPKEEASEIIRGGRYVSPDGNEKKKKNTHTKKQNQNPKTKTKNKAGPLRAAVEPDTHLGHCNLLM